MNDDKRVAAAKEAIVPFLCLNSEFHAVVAQKNFLQTTKGIFVLLNPCRRERSVCEPAKNAYTEVPPTTELSA